MSKLRIFNTIMLFSIASMLFAIFNMINFHFTKENKDTLRIRCVPELSVDNSPEISNLKSPQDEMRYLLNNPGNLQ